MGLGTRVGVLGLASACALFAASAPADAAKTIKGKLSKPGYTVIALTGDGRATSTRAEGGDFRLRTAAGKVTLHLRGPDGSYAGPITVRAKANRPAGNGKRARAKGERVIVGVRAGAELGRVKVRRGYAKASKRLPDGSIDRKRTARAKNGAPIGAASFGRVRSRPPPRSPRNAPPGDPDLDGIPSIFDVDDDGDLILDQQDRRTSRRATRRLRGGGEDEGEQPDPEIFSVGARLELQLETTANVNPRSAADPQKPAFDDAQIEAALPRYGSLTMNLLPGQFPELDCGGAIQDPPRPEGLVYCRPHSAGGIGVIPPLTPGPPQPFPDCCDNGAPGDPDGNGTLTPTPPGAPGMMLLHRATADQIAPGDVLMQRVTRDGTEIGFLNTLQLIFATVPALASYSDGTGPHTAVSYPVAAGGPGTLTNAIPVRDDPSSADPDQDIEVELTYWRLQRKGEPAWGENGDAWIDLGRLDYQVQAGFGGGRCPQDAFAIDDEALRPDDPEDEQAPGFTDLRHDRVADPINTFTFTLNLTRCFAANGISFAPGDPHRNIGLAATSFGGADPVAFAIASQTVYFKPQ
jgi:hypothetical protein